MTSGQDSDISKSSELIVLPHFRRRCEPAARTARVIRPGARSAFRPRARCCLIRLSTAP